MYDLVLVDSAEICIGDILPGYYNSQYFQGSGLGFDTLAVVVDVNYTDWITEIVVADQEDSRVHHHIVINDLSYPVAPHVVRSQQYIVAERPEQAPRLCVRRARADSAQQVSELRQEHAEESMGVGEAQCVPTSKQVSDPSDALSTQYLWVSFDELRVGDALARSEHPVAVVIERLPHAVVVQSLCKSAIPQVLYRGERDEYRVWRVVAGVDTDLTSAQDAVVKTSKYIMQLEAELARCKAELAKGELGDDPGR